MKVKTFVILTPGPDASDFMFQESILGTIDEARDALKASSYADGEYRIAEIVTRVNKQTITVEPTVKITFEPTRKRPRAAKAK
jgi:hypothetical protein